MPDVLVVLLPVSQTIWAAADQFQTSVLCTDDHVCDWLCFSNVNEPSAAVEIYLAETIMRVCAKGDLTCLTSLHLTVL